jgi:hypothetical protein
MRCTHRNVDERYIRQADVLYRFGVELRAFIWAGVDDQYASVNHAATRFSLMATFATIDPA